MIDHCNKCKRPKKFTFTNGKFNPVCDDCMKKEKEIEQQVLEARQAKERAEHRANLRERHRKRKERLKRREQKNNK